MRIQVFPDADSVARAAAAFVAGEARECVAARGRFLLAVSGGHTPWQMLRALAREDVPWKEIFLLQVDERIAPAGDADRNLTHLRESLLSHAPLPEANLLAMPVEESNLEAAAQRYARRLAELGGHPPVLDLVHLGLGPDGHTASLIPGDPVLEVMDRDISLTGPYQGRRRMTMTYPLINRARQILWLVTGKDKEDMLPRLLRQEDSIPAGAVLQDRARLMTDQMFDLA